MDGVAAAFDRPLVENDLARADVERTLEAVADEYPDLDVDAAAEAALPEGARPVNYPCLLAAVGGSLRQGLPGSTTRFAGTTAVPVGSAVSTGVASE